MRGLRSQEAPKAVEEQPETPQEDLEVPAFLRRKMKPQLKYENVNR